MINLFLTSSVAILLLKLGVLLALSPTTNCLSLDCRSQLEKLSEDFVKITHFFFYVKINSSFNYTLKISYKTLVIFHEKVKMKNLLAAKDASFTFERARLEELESKVARLEELELKMTRLEDTVQKQEKMIISLQPKETPIGSGKFIPSHLALNDQPKIGKSASFPRTCRELRSYDPSLNSGMHWIDPDGQGVGDDPIYVYCDMAKGTEFSSLSNRYRIVIKNVILLYRFHFYPTRQ